MYNTYRDLHTRIILNNVLKITLDKLLRMFFVILINNFMYLKQRSPIQIAVGRADFTQTSVTDPIVTGQSNSIPTKLLLSAPKEVFTSKNYLQHERVLHLYGLVIKFYP